MKTIVRTCILTPLWVGLSCIWAQTVPVTDNIIAHFKADGLTAEASEIWSDASQNNNYVTQSTVANDNQKKIGAFSTPENQPNTNLLVLKSGHPTIQAAVVASAAGDNVQVTAGSYDGFTDNIGVKLDMCNRPGCATVTFMTLTNTTTFIINIFGDDPCTGYDQWRVLEELDLNNAQIEIRLADYTPPVGKVFTIFEYGTLIGELNTPQFIKANGSYFIINCGDKNNGTITLTTVVPLFKMQIRKVVSDR